MNDMPSHGSEPLPPAPPSPSPYAAPIAPPLPAPDGRPYHSTAVDYVSVAGRASATLILLGIVILLDVASLITTLMQISSLSAMQGNAVPEDLSTADVLQALVAFAQVAVLIGTAIAFLMWMHRAHRNLKALGAEGLEFTSGWAIGYFFIPFLNLVRPYQAMAEIWKASEPDLPPGPNLNWKNIAIPSLLSFWWGAYLLSNVVSQFSGRASLAADTTDELLAANRADLFAVPLSIVSALLAMAVVRGVTARQEARMARLRNAPIAPDTTSLIP